MSIENRKRIYPTCAQKARLIARLELDHGLRSGKFSTSFTKKEAERRWETIAQELNSIPGAKKTWIEWRKTWHDMKSLSKKKNTAIRRAQSMTGGGAAPPSLTEEDVQILSTMSVESLIGHQDSRESEVEFAPLKKIINPVPIIKLKKDQLMKIKTIPKHKDPEVNIKTEFQCQEAGSVMPSTSSKYNVKDTLKTTPSNSNDSNDIQPSTSREEKFPSRSHLPKSKKNALKPLQNTFNMTEELVNQLKIKNKFKQEFYEKYILEMQKQTEALMCIARNLENPP